MAWTGGFWVRDAVSGIWVYLPGMQQRSLGTFHGWPAAAVAPPRSNTAPGVRKSGSTPKTPRTPVSGGGRRKSGADHKERKGSGKGAGAADEKAGGDSKVLAVEGASQGSVAASDAEETRMAEIVRRARRGFFASVVPAL